MCSVTGDCVQGLDTGVDYDAIAQNFAQIALEAGVGIMQIYASQCEFRQKADSSPVCAADEGAEALILEHLAELMPGVPVVAEEAAARGAIPECSHSLILVDPLDGTCEFMSRNGEFTVNIALVIEGIPRAGAVYAPALAKLWFGGTKAYGCEVAPGASLPSPETWHSLNVRAKPADGLTALASRSHNDVTTERFLAQLPIKERRNAGSSLKFCMIAEAEADVYPRFGPTMEWDTAAGDAVLRAAGGMVKDQNGQALRYGKSDQRYKNGGFIAWGDVSPLL